MKNGSRDWMRTWMGWLLLDVLRLPRVFFGIFAPASRCSYYFSNKTGSEEGGMGKAARGPFSWRNLWRV